MFIDIILLVLLGLWAFFILKKRRNGYYGSHSIPKHYEDPNIKLIYPKCPRCGGVYECTGMSDKGVEWTCFNSNCMSWPQFLYKKRKEGYSTKETSKSWKEHKEKYYES